MIAIICIGSGILLLLLIAVYLIISSSRALTYKKRTKDKETHICITAKKNLHKVSVVSKEITFERDKVKKGTDIEFVFPSNHSIKIIYEEKPGKSKVLEVS